MINILLPMALLLMFAVSALAVLLFATRIYQNTVDSSILNEESGTAISYLCEKIHSSDSTGSIRLSKTNGIQALSLEQTVEGEVYTTYVYAFDGKLMEVFVKAGTEFAPSSGRAIMEIHGFSLTALRDDLLKISCTDHSGKTAWTVVAIRSEGGCAQ